MIILFMLFLIQFSIACSCLAVNSQQQAQFAEEGWNQVPTSIRKEVQDTFICCGFNSTTSDPSLSCDNVKVIKSNYFKLYILLFFFCISIVANVLLARLIFGL